MSPCTLCNGDGWVEVFDGHGFPVGARECEQCHGGAFVVGATDLPAGASAERVSAYEQALREIAQAPWSEHEPLIDVACRAAWMRWRAQTALALPGEGS